MRSSSAPPFGAAALLFFLSGAGALVVETTWLRWFRPLFGATAPAASATLVAFFAGQALGAAAGARLARRAANPLAGYARLEAAAAAWALAVPALLALGAAAGGSVYDALREWPAALTALRFASALAATLPAAFCFGATLPMLGSALIAEVRGLGVRGAALYGVNTAGAATGAALAAFLLPDWLGVRAGYGVGLALLLLAAAGAALLARRGAAAPGPPPAPKPAASPAGSGPGDRRLAALAGISGFGSFATQVLLVQSFALVLDQSVYAFGVVLVTVLVCLATGALVLAGLESRRRLAPDRVARALLAAAAVGLAAFPALFVSATDGLEILASARPWPGYLWASLGLALGTAGPALLAAAGVLPATFALAARGGGAGPRPGARLGALAAANTAGAIAGALAAPYVLVPGVGLWPAFAVLAALYALASGAVPRASLARVGTVLAVACAALGLARPWELPSVRLEPGERLVALEQGAAGIVAAVQDRGGLRLQTDNHYVLGGTAEQVHEERQGHLPLLLRPGARRVAYLGSATGISAGAVLAHPVEHLAVVEVVPAVASLAADVFRPFNRDVYADPRSSVVLDDARNFLRATQERFDVIVADLFVPWRAGTGSLYTREHFRAARERLLDGGVYCQWLPLYQLSEEEFQIVAATFLDVFPEAGLWRGDFYGRFPIVALVGHAGRPAAAAAIQAAATRLGEAGETDRWVTHPLGLWSLYVGPLAAFGAAAGEVPRNSDDRPRIEYGAARARARRGSEGAFVGIAFQAFAEQLRRIAASQGDPLHPDLSPEARRAGDGGHALQAAGALYVAGRGRESARALAAAAARLPRSLLADAPADDSAAEVWRAE